MAATIGDVHSAHEFCRDNEFIHKGYRINFSSTKRIFKSLFMIHNESVNVWTHLLGVMLFVFLLWHSLLMLGYTPQAPELSQAFNQTRIAEWRDFVESKIESTKERLSEFETQAIEYSNELEHRFANWYTELQSEAADFSQVMGFKWLSEKNHSRAVDLLLDFRVKLHSMADSFGVPDMDPIERWPMVIFILSAMFCLLCSVICHLFSAHSYGVHCMVSRLDYAGISILIAGSYFPVVFYIFYCNPTAMLVYLSGISTFSIFVFLVAMAPFFQKPEYRALRGLSFLALGLLGVVPFTHMLFLPNIEHFQVAIIWFMMMALCYIVGVGFYIIRIPERFFPGKFDFWGSSHNIWHCFVLAACVCHYVGSRWSFYLRHEATCEAY